jgi:phosphoribosylformylglycinamidine synthase PurS subunit
MLKAYIDVILKESILDPQGTAVKEGLLKLGFKAEDVRIGKHIEILLDDIDIDKASKIVEQMCEKLLVNPEIETYRYSFKEE